MIDAVTPTITIKLTDLNNVELSRIATEVPIYNGKPNEFLSKTSVIKAGQRYMATASVANYLDITVFVAEVV